MKSRDETQELRRSQGSQERNRWALVLGNLKEAGMTGSSGKNGVTVVKVSPGSESMKNLGYERTFK